MTEKEMNNVQVYDRMLEGWHENKGAMTAPNGYVWISNGVSVFSSGYRHGLLRR